MPSAGLSFLLDGVTALLVPYFPEFKTSTMYYFCFMLVTHIMNKSSGWLYCCFHDFYSKLCCASTRGLLIRHLGIDRVLQGFITGSAANIVLNDKLGFGKVRGRANVRLPLLEPCRLLFLDR